ncbi:MAG: choice-of-anchor I family protein [Azoarcus sp.]|nr:choice-of-anchor I family protein [Azoarcus sp.]
MTSMLRGALLCAGLVSMPALAVPAVQWESVWRYEHADTGVAGQKAEIPAYDQATDTLWVAGVKGIDVLNASTGTLVRHIDLSDLGDVNSVAIRNGVAAVAVAAPDHTQPGAVQLFDSTSYARTDLIRVGALPDMVTFTPDGSRLLVANEGERAVMTDPTSFDPAGSVSIIDMASRTVVATAGFAGVTGADSVRLFPGKTADVDLEPEYIAVSPDGTKAFVSLQEANAVGILDLATNRFTEVKSLGAKDYSLPGNGIDPSDKDGVVAVRNVPVLGMYMPDSMAAYSVAGQTYFVTANEGDTRDEDVRVKDLILDPTAFPDAAELKKDKNLGRLTVSPFDGVNADGKHEALYSYGARSFSIRDENGDLVFDSGDDFERILGDRFPDIFDDGRSDNKGPEPEGIALLEIGGRTLAFIGFERTLEKLATAVIAIYDITDPRQAQFLDLIVSPGDLAPEGLVTFSRGGQSFLAVASEGSDTTSLFRINLVPEPGSMALALTAIGLLGVMRRKG